MTVREQVERLIRRHAGSRRFPPLLIQGDTGTGKGLLARSLHQSSPRRDAPFVDVNCAAIPETLLEAELFGFERGAFTDARQSKPGLFQSAHRGTIFLDELALLPRGLQGKLLTVVEERTVRRLGSTRSEAVDIWLVAATSEDLLAAVREGRFHDALYHRLSVLTLWLPPLRDRGGDILLLAEHFLARACADHELPCKTLSLDAREALRAHPWPGNVRELINAMERVALLVDAPVVTRDALALSKMPATRAVKKGTSSLRAAVGSVERETLISALNEANGIVTHAAARLGIPPNTLRYRMRKHQLDSGPLDGPSTTPPDHVSPHMTPISVSGEIRWASRWVAVLRAVLARPIATDPPGSDDRLVATFTEKAQSFGGRLEELSHTGIVAAFGLEPTEDAGRRAARAAIAVQNAVRRAMDEGAGPWSTKIGIHVGRLPVGQVGGTSFIEAEAKRHAWSVLEALTAGAEWDAIALSAEAAASLAKYFELASSSTTMSLSRAVYRLVGAERPVFEPLGNRTRLIGRVGELELLRNRWISAEEGRGQVVGIVGDAGIGKSRLLFEFRERLSFNAVAVFQGRCLSYATGTPYFPFLEVIRDVSGIRDDDAVDALIAKLRRRLAEVSEDADERFPYLLQLFGVSRETDRPASVRPDVIKARTFETIRRLLLKGGAHRPVVIIVEDLHWIDPTSEECLATLVDSTATAHALVLVTYRPGYRPPWVEKSYVTQVALPTLSREESLAVVRSTLPMDDVPEALVNAILERGQGNPFFLEELARAVAGTGDVEASGPIPDTIETVLMARIERLPANDRQLLHTASVIGPDVPVPLLQIVADLGEEELRRSLASLQAAEFLYEAASDSGPEYTFKHALTHEVAYDTLPAERRREIHARALRAMEALHRDRLSEHVERLAIHAVRGELLDEALQYLRQAGLKANAHSALDDARVWFEQALTVQDSLPETVVTLTAAFEIRVELRAVLTQLGEVRMSLERLREADALAARLHDDDRRGRVSALMTNAQALLGKLDAALASGTRALALARTLGNDELSILSATYLAQTQYYRTEYARAVAISTETLDVIRRTGVRDFFGLPGPPAVWVRLWLIAGLAELGRFAEAAQHESEAISLIESGHPATSIGMAHFAAATFHPLRGDWAKAHALVERGIAAVRAGRVALMLPRAVASSAWILAQVGETREALNRLWEGERLLERHTEKGIVCQHGTAYHALGRACILLDQLDEARRMAECAVEASSQQPGCLAHALHLLGDVSSHPDRLDAASGRGYYDRALALAQARGMRPLVAHCHFGLGRLHAQTGATEAARDVLALAAAMYSEMDMPFWLERAESARRSLR